MSSSATLDTLVPPTRLAAALVEARQHAGLTLSDIETRCAGSFSLSELAAFESAATVITDTQLRLLAHGYGIDLSQIAPSRASLEIDRSEGRLIVGPSTGTFLPDDDDRKILTRYLALVYRMREAQPGDLLAPRDGDLLVFAEVFGCSPEVVREHLTELMLQPPRELRASHARLQHRAIIPALGILVALTAAGGLLLTSSSAAPSATRPTVSAVAKVDIGTALVIERNPSVVATAAKVDIGTALVIERPSTPVTPRVDIGTALMIERASNDTPSAHKVDIGTALSIEREI